MGKMTDICLDFCIVYLSKMTFSLTSFYKAKNNTNMVSFCFWVLLLLLLLFNRKSLALSWLTGYLRTGAPAGRTETSSVANPADERETLRLI